jgi:hypothetical protein
MDNLQWMKFHNNSCNDNLQWIEIHNNSCNDNLQWIEIHRRDISRPDGTYTAKTAKG